MIVSKGVKAETMGVVRKRIVDNNCSMAGDGRKEHLFMLRVQQLIAFMFCRLL